VGRSLHPNGARGPEFCRKAKGMKIKGSAKDQPSYRIIQGIDA
jgi:hypothetical protein